MKTKEMDAAPGKQPISSRRFLEDANFEDLFDTNHQLWVKGCRLKRWHYLFGCEQAK
jgi:hypothetical protein